MSYKLQFYTLLMGLLLVTSCTPDEEDNIPNVPKLKGDKVPSSSRSIGVIRKVAPRLVQELDEKGLQYGAPVYIRIFKESEEFEVWLKDGEKFRLFQTYKIAAYSGELGPKLKEGDRQAPEGFYYVPASRMNPNSRFHLAFNVGYPNAFDRANKRTGSAIMVHGSTCSIGCFAMTDPKIEEIYTLCHAALRNGQKYFRVHIFPFRMTASNLAWHKDSKWVGFWKNLKEGYDYFELHKRPPNTEVAKRRYVFE